MGVLEKDFKGSLKGLSKPFSAFARKEMEAAGHILPHDKLKQLKNLGARFYICGPSMTHFGVKKADLMFDDMVIVEYLTFFAVMKNADINLFLQ
jgi:predicted peroxiredoxin